jgi:hypothetical protein
MPSVLFFLMCVIPSLWIISIDEAGRKQRFLSLASSQEARLKEFAASSFGLLDLNSNKTSEIFTPGNKSVSHFASGNSYYIDSKSLANLIRNQPIKSLSDQIAMALSQTELVNASIITSAKLPAATLTSLNTTFPSQVNNTDSKINEKSNIECCDTEITYWFREDQYQNLFFQLFLLILVSSRWLVTSSARLSSTQRTFILILSMANALDTLDLYSCLSLEFVFKSSHLVYALLMMVSISLLQFLFIPTVSSESSGAEGVHRTLSREYEDSLSVCENVFRSNETVGSPIHGNNYDDLREPGGTSGQETRASEVET